MDSIVDETIRAFGGVDILVNNAGTADRYGPIVETGSDEWDRVMRVNLKAAFMMCKFCHPHMKSRGGGSIINVASNEAVRPSAGLGAYSVSKGAMVTLTQICAKEWGRDKIRVNCIAPGLIRTAMAKPLVKMVEKSGHYPNALKMIGEPEDIAGIALLLASDAGRYATGQTSSSTGASWLPLRWTTDEYEKSRIGDHLIANDSSVGRPGPRKKVHTPRRSSIGRAAQQCQPT